MVMRPDILAKAFDKIILAATGKVILTQSKPFIKKLRIFLAGMIIYAEDMKELMRGLYLRDH